LFHFNGKDMTFEYFIGVDVSKKCLDFALVTAGQVRFHLQVENTVAGIRQALKSLKSQGKVRLSQALFCVEHTGLYQNTLLACLNKQQAYIWLESALHIKAGGGLQRGKTDKVDALRIALYAYKNQERIKTWQPPRPQVQELRALAALRNRLLEAKKQLQVPLQEQKPLLANSLMRQLEQNSRASLQALEKDIAQTEACMQAIINQDAQLKHYFELLTSVQGIGPVTATQVIIATNEFQDFQQPKAFACHAGVAPFAYQSGSSVRGKTKVSPKADKKLKRLLHLAALTAIRIKGELQDYYLRKVEQGKHKMSVLNAIRNKLILRMFAVVKQNKKYEKIYPLPLAPVIEI
jgi:transposase